MPDKPDAFVVNVRAMTEAFSKTVEATLPAGLSDEESAATILAALCETAAAVISVTGDPPTMLLAMGRHIKIRVAALLDPDDCPCPVCTAAREGRVPPLMPNGSTH